MPDEVPAVGAEIGRRPGTEQEDRAGGCPGREAVEGVEGGHDLVHARWEERREQRRGIVETGGTSEIDRREAVPPEAAAAQRDPLRLDLQRPVDQETTQQGVR